MTATGVSGDADALTLLESAVADLSSDYLPGVTPAELGERCLRLLAVRDRLDGVAAAHVAEADRAGVPRLGNQRTMAQYLASRTHCAPEVVRADLRVGFWAGQFALFEKAMLDGRMSRKHVDLLRKTVNIRVFAAMQRDQFMFIEWVDTLEWPDYKNHVKYWLEVNDQDGPEPEDFEAKNSCTVTTRSDGTVKIVLILDPVSGEIAKHQIELDANALFNQDSEDGVVRTPTQRRAQAAAELIERGAGRSETNAKPLIHVVMSLKVLQNAVAQMAKDREDQDFTSCLDPNDVDGRCELIDGTPIHPKYALVLLMNARIRRQVLTAKSKTLNASSEVRAFPTWMKYTRLVETRGRCETAGCDAIVEWLQGDHHKPFSQTQRTTLADLRNICTPDNQTKGDGPPLAERKPPLPNTSVAPSEREHPHT